ncbi:hypothetical protein BDY17DRAFT_313198 [Neohortaea acidophila]|uniref:SnoaL-like domain-containing protein n=1 Tax=Neohortaea acidophila TaxID=245834 RepID=A0A6A6PHY4_9PEZI|nr:uncharacterized protein BDY17DRAFT_313198 [Neohortaea acidophila]KAF2479341.1 hypothetical protein BDY17DRAFT_313198 [Neohortaea acidophila]
MSKAYTKPAYVVHNHFGKETREHPALRFIEALAQWFDQPDHSNKEDFFVDSWSIKTPDGEHWDEGLESYEDAIEKFYKGPFAKYKHNVFTLIAIESEDGYDTYTQANVAANLTGKAAKGEQKVKDSHGEEWDVLVPVFFHHELVKVPGAPHEGLKCSHVKIFKDTGVVNAKLEARGEKGSVY